jgi:glycerophosphoryl diester phosphodiesterase
MASALPPLYAHRPGRHYGPDSSAAALRHTLTGPVEGLETDVCLTADDRLVLLHDPLITLITTLDVWAFKSKSEEYRSDLIRDSVV